MHPQTLFRLYSVHEQNLNFLLDDHVKKEIKERIGC
jgi:hypothetical protein